MRSILMTLRPGAPATKRLTLLLGERLVAVRYRSDGAGARVRTVELTADAGFIEVLRAALTTTPASPHQGAVPELPSLLDALADLDDAAASAAPPTAPCACAALLRADAGSHLTFVFAATTAGDVFATVAELPAVWATGSSIDDARTSLCVELALALAANPMRERARHCVTDILAREEVVLPPRIGRADDGGSRSPMERQ